MKTDILIGAYTLKTKGKLATADISIIYTPDSSNISYKTVTTANVSTLFTIPSPYNRVQFFCVGGGGGGGDAGTTSEGAFDSNYKQNAFGGGGGGYVAISSVITTKPEAKFGLFVGSGGAINRDGGTTYVTSSGSDVIVSAAGGKAGGSPVSTTKVYTQASLSSYSYVKGWAGGAGGSGGGGGRAMGGTTGDHYWGSSADKTYCTNGANGYKAKAVNYDDYTGSSDWTTYTAESIGSGISTIDPWDTTITYSGGGGGGSTAPTESTPLRGGTGGGGTGCNANKNVSQGSAHYTNAGAGTAGTGGGGGGGASYTSSVDSLRGAAGGSGVIRIKLWEA